MSNTPLDYRNPADEDPADEDPARRAGWGGFVVSVLGCLVCSGIAGICGVFFAATAWEMITDGLWRAWSTVVAWGLPTFAFGYWALYAGVEAREIWRLKRG